MSESLAVQRRAPPKILSGVTVAPSLTPLYSRRGKDSSAGVFSGKNALLN
jgi:hypothetical protein